MVAVRGGNGRFQQAAFWAAVMATVGLLLVLVGRPIPIIIWDEGRIIISAMEMRHSGIGLVTTYDFVPDLWNTKPPMLVWLMTGSMAMFGPTEFALRLPSLMAALGTLLLVMLFLRRITSSVAIAAFGGMALATSVGFFGEHGARTADFDALLCFFTTAYLLLLFFAVHRSPPPRGWLLLAGVMAAGALMTKGLAGGIPGAGLLLYLVLVRRWHRLFETPRYWVAALLAGLPMLLFLFLREAAAPGFLHAMLFNDVSGRFNNPASINNSGPPWYYLDTTFARGLFSLGTLTLLAPLALPFARGRVRLALLFALCIAVGQLAVVTMSGTKLAHYYLSAYPFLAIAAALAVHALFLWMTRSVRAGRLAPRSLWIARLVPVALLALGAMQAIDACERVLAPREHYPRTRYGALLDALSGVRAPVLLIEPGINIPDDPHYAPELRFYAMVARQQGRSVAHVGKMDGIASAAPDTILASCDPSIVPLLQRQGADIILERDGCLARWNGGQASLTQPPSG